MTDNTIAPIRTIPRTELGEMIERLEKQILPMLGPVAGENAADTRRAHVYLSALRAVAAMLDTYSGPQPEITEQGFEL